MVAWLCKTLSYCVILFIMQLLHIVSLVAGGHTVCFNICSIMQWSCRFRKRSWWKHSLLKVIGKNFLGIKAFKIWWSIMVLLILTLLSCGFLKILASKAPIVYDILASVLPELTVSSSFLSIRFRLRVTTVITGLVEYELRYLFFLTPLPQRSYNYRFTSNVRQSTSLFCAVIVQFFFKKLLSSI